MSTYYQETTPLHVQHEVHENNETIKPMKRSRSNSVFSLLTRATSIMTSESSEDDNDNGHTFKALKKKVSFSGISILPTVYGSTESDDDECSCLTGSTIDGSDDMSFFDPINDHDGSDAELGLHRSEPEIENHTDLTPLSTTNDSTPEHLSQHLLSLSHTFQAKAKGAKSHEIAPRFDLSECMWTFSGSFIIVFIVSFLSTSIPFWNESGHAFPLGPFGALTTLQYSLNDSLPAQPRNVILGSTLSGCIAMCTTYIPVTILPISVRIALATSSSIAMMAFLGIMHPPAGAIALVFAMGSHHWGHLLLTLCGCVIAVVVAVIVNNLNSRSQYPQYWHFLGPFEGLFCKS